MHGSQAVPQRAFLQGLVVGGGPVQLSQGQALSADTLEGRPATTQKSLTPQGPRLMMWPGIWCHEPGEKLETSCAACSGYVQEGRGACVSCGTTQLGAQTRTSGQDTSTCWLDCSKPCTFIHVQGLTAGEPLVAGLQKITHLQALANWSAVSRQG